MRFVIYGTGGIGGVIGARLFASGHEVVLVARGAHGRGIAANGLRLESPEETLDLRIPVVEHPSQIAFDGAEVVVLAMKSHQTGGALDELALSTPPDIAVLCAQNGLANERAALRLFGRVYGMCVMCPASYLKPGVVQAHSTPTTGVLDVGCYPSGIDDTAVQVASSLAASTFSSLAVADVMRWKHTKLLMNLANAVEALCGAAERDGELARLARAEGVACLNAAGLAFASDEEDKARRADWLKLRPIAGQRRGGGSSWQSLARGAGSIETDYLNGEVVLLGRLHGVPTPVNELLQQYARRAAHDGWMPEAVGADQLLAELTQPAPGVPR